MGSLLLIDSSSDRSDFKTLHTKNLLILSLGLIITVEEQPGFGELNADPASEHVSVADDDTLRVGDMLLFV